MPAPGKNETITPNIDCAETSSEQGYDAPNNFRDELIEIIKPAKALSEKHGLVYTAKYLEAALLSAEIEAGWGYYLREADEQINRSRPKSYGDY